MLGWFKKKFGKKPVEPETVAPELTQEAAPETAVAESSVELPAAEQGVAPISQPAADAKTAVAVPEREEPEPEPLVPIGQEMAETVCEVGKQPAAEPLPEEPAAHAEEADAVVEEGVAEPCAECIPAPALRAAEPVEEASRPEAPPLEEPEVDVVVEAPVEFVSEEPVAPLPEVEEAIATVEIAAPVEVACVPQAPSTPEAAEQEDGREEGAGVEPEEVAVEGLAAVLEPAPADAETISPAAPLAEKTQHKPASKSLFKRLQERLGKTRDAFIYRLDRLFLGKKEIDQDLFEQLEEILIMADLGVTTTLELLDNARKKVKRDQLSDPQALKAIIRDQILAYIEASEQPAELVMPDAGPFVIMVVGVNGVGKTTSIGKIAAKFVRSGQSVLLVAGDTFRAAAINQLRIWGERVGVEVIAQKPGADPSSVVFDGLEYGLAHKHDVILIDTAGRLHTSVNLMEELKKIKRVIGKKVAGAPHEVMLVLDATTGQNGISQAKLFHEAVGVTGLTLTKLDGTAKGGIVANVCRETKIPVRFIGIGEQIDDLRDFDAREFVDALFAGRAEGEAA
jgi:fused signal recognition particle receptor